MTVTYMYMCHAAAPSALLQLCTCFQAALCRVDFLDLLLFRHPAALLGQPFQAAYMLAIWQQAKWTTARCLVRDGRDGGPGTAKE
jgi:hypothetical protein